MDGALSFETWWLLAIPVLFGLGWVAARVDQRQMNAEERNLPDSYFRGLNFLLNDQSDRAIDAFIEVAKLNTETIELHFALGNLFRRRGELERAIRVHQNLLQREDLPVEQREQALFALAQDYLRAGMFDRAEASYKDLTQCPLYSSEALRALVRIYETEREWDKAIASALALQKQVSEPVPQIVHFYCEKAVLAMNANTPVLSEAQQALQSAQTAIDRWGGMVTKAGLSAAQIRLWMLSSQLASVIGDHDQQRLLIQKIFDQAPTYAGLVAKQWLGMFAHDTVKREESIRVLKQVYEQAPSLDLFQVLFLAIFEVYGDEEAGKFVRQGLVSQPSLLSLEAWISAQINHYDVHPSPTATYEDLKLVQGLLRKYTQRVDRYACRACGFKAKKFHWQCPGCNAWETYLPKRIEELDA